MKNHTILLGWRKATKAEKKSKGADVVFTREDEDGKEYTIYGCKCYESWEQWGQPGYILSENVDAIEEWRQSL